MKLCLTVLLVLAADAASAQDPPPIPSLTISDVVVREGNQGAHRALFMVTLTNAPPGPVTVHYATRNLTAHAGSDYTGVAGLLEFHGTDTAEIGVDIIGDIDATEGSEVFFVQLSSPTDAVIADDFAHAVIHDDDLVVRRTRCDLDGDGHSNLMAYYELHDHAQFTPFRHNPQHEDWSCKATVCERGAPVEYEAGAHADWVLLAMANFDNNGTCDLFWKRDDEVAFTYTAPGAGLKAPPAIRGDGPTLSGPGPDWRLVGSGFLDGDQRADLLWWKAAPPQTLRVWLTTGPNTWESHDLLVASAETLDPLAVADLRGDGSVGIVWRDATGGLIHWAMRGLTLLEATPLVREMGDVVGVSWTLAAVGDFNGDGHEDLAWQGPGKEVAVWFMRNTTRLAESLFSPQHLISDNHRGVVRGPR